MFELPSSVFRTDLFLIVLGKVTFATFVPTFALISLVLISHGEGWKVPRLSISLFLVLLKICLPFVGNLTEGSLFLQLIKSRDRSLRPPLEWPERSLLINGFSSPQYFLWMTSLPNLFTLTCWFDIVFGNSNFWFDVWSMILRFSLYLSI